MKSVPEHGGLAETCDHVWLFPATRKIMISTAPPLLSSGSLPTRALFQPLQCIAQLNKHRPGRHASSSEAAVYKNHSIPKGSLRPPGAGDRLGHDHRLEWLGRHTSPLEERGHRCHPTSGGVVFVPVVRGCAALRYPCWSQHGHDSGHPAGPQAEGLAKGVLKPQTTTCDQKWHSSQKKVPYPRACHHKSCMSERL